VKIQIISLWLSNDISIESHFRKPLLQGNSKVQNDVEHQEKTSMGGKTPLLIPKVTTQAWEQSHS